MLQKNFRSGPMISLRRFVLASHEIVLQWNVTVSASPLLFALESIHSLQSSGQFVLQGAIVYLF